MGFEPTTLGTTIRCSNQLSYMHHFRSGTSIVPKQGDKGTTFALKHKFYRLINHILTI